MLNTVFSSLRLTCAIALSALVSAGCQAPNNLNSSINPGATARTISDNVSAASTPRSTAPELAQDEQDTKAISQPIVRTNNAPDTTTSDTEFQQPDENGDYYQPRLRSEGTKNWRVSDPDPTGLNCRMRSDWQDMSFARVDASDEFLGKDYDADLTSWDVVAVFNQGDSLRADAGHMGQGHFALDRDGKPWLAVSISGTNTCFVRANSAFIQPQ